MEKLDFLINYLLSERNDVDGIKIPETQADKFRLYRSLVNIRPAVKADEDYLQAEDEYLTALTESKGITDIADLSPIEDGIYLWKGDITTLRCGAIVNAARNDGVLAALPLLYRQLHTHLCRGTASLQVRSDHESARSGRTHRQGEDHACLQPALQLCDTHRRTDRAGTAHRGALPSA